MKNFFRRIKTNALVLLICLFDTISIRALDATTMEFPSSVIVGAERLDQYLPFLKKKKVALLINQTSIVYHKHLLDTLLSSGVNVVKVFVPEHGFRGTADAGAHINTEIDAATGLPIISLYGKNKKPSAEQMKDIDVLVYDLQDVGVRFYTYISTLEYAMDACIENNKELLILDRPNPNRHVVDGPVLDTNLRSFVGMQPVPVVYGMTVGEYAQMLVGEQWIKNAHKLNYKIITCNQFKPLHQLNREVPYKLPVPPSPNLKNMGAIYYYPSLCFFEGTVVSVGRGTDYPFQQWGHPDFKGKFDYFFVPKSKVGASKPLLEGQECYGEALRDAETAMGELNGQICINYVIKAYNLYPQKDKFFNSFFEKLAGTKELRQQIIAGKSEQEIRMTWRNELKKFRQIRNKYLLYEDEELAPL